MDLTRFDFNVHDFLNSESVEVMSDAEVGQYILLLAKSWSMAKDASLPNDPELLARWSHCAAVSPRVLAKFPLTDTEWGSRLRNKRLYGEWLSSVYRSNSAAEKGRKGNEVRWSDNRSDGSSDKVAIAKTSPNQAKPSIPSQSDQSSQASQESEFRNIAIRYRSFFQSSHSKSAQFKDKYKQACDKFGENEVLARFDEWGAANVWRKDNLRNTGLRFFLADLPELVEEAAASNQITEQREGPKEDLSAIQTQIEQSRVIAPEVVERLAEIEADRVTMESLKANPNLF